MGVSKVAKAFELIILARVLLGVCAGTRGDSGGGSEADTPGSGAGAGRRERRVPRPCPALTLWGSLLSPFPAPAKLLLSPPLH